VLPMDEVVTAYYLRLQANDKPGVMADVTRILAEQGISIEALIQKEPEEGATSLPIILLTHRITEKQMNAAIEAIEALATVHKPVMRIRVESLG